MWHIIGLSKVKTKVKFQLKKPKAMNQAEQFQRSRVSGKKTYNHLKEVIDRLITKNNQREKLIELGKLMEGGKISPDEGMDAMRKVLEGR